MLTNAKSLMIAKKCSTYAMDRNAEEINFVKVHAALVSEKITMALECASTLQIDLASNLRMVKSVIT